MRALAAVSVLLILVYVQAQQSPHRPSASSRPSHAKAVDPGTVENGAYRNPSFGFTYKIPFGWVDRTDKMRDDSTDPTKAQLLLAVFERPPEVASDAVNSGVVIAAESVSNYPGLKTAADYFGPLGGLTAKQGFTPEADPYEFAVGARKLARADYSKQRGKDTVRQSSLAMMAKGYVVSFTFIGGSEDETEDLIQGLSFGSGVGPKSRP
ncbi:MAG TPA: hypothetical protein VMH85_13015 [Terriglobales bacterium]|nr:hypothetical protein [Terriglobales bacterium]